MRPSRRLEAVRTRDMGRPNTAGSGPRANGQPIQHLPYRLIYGSSATLEDWFQLGEPLAHAHQAGSRTPVQFVSHHHHHGPLLTPKCRMGCSTVLPLRFRVAGFELREVVDRLDVAFGIGGKA